MMLGQPHGVKPQRFAELDLLANLVQHLGMTDLMLPVVHLGMKAKFHRSHPPYTKLSLSQVAARHFCYSFGLLTLQIFRGWFYPP